MYQQVFYIKHADNIVRAALIYREPCEFLTPENVQHFFVRTFYIKEGHIYPGNHDIFCQRVPEVKNIVYHLPFFTFNYAVLVAYIHDSTQFMLGHGRRLCRRIHPQKREHEKRQLIDNENSRCQYSHEK